MPEGGPLDGLIARKAGRAVFEHLHVGPRALARNDSLHFGNRFGLVSPSVSGGQ